MRLVFYKRCLDHFIVPFVQPSCSLCSKKRTQSSQSISRRTQESLTFGMTLLLAAVFSSITSIAQKKDSLKYINAETLTFVGKIAETRKMYHRIDTVLYPDLPARVKGLLTNSAGLAITFKTNSSVIAAKWCVTKSKAATNLTPIANKGLDIYIKKDGQWQFAGVGRPTGECTEDEMVENMDNSEKECLVYLPLYDELTKLEIGVEQNAMLTPTPSPFEKRVLIYGSSIVQGASASRPGLAYPAMLSRATGVNFLNMGLSASAKMEKAAADLVAATPADAYILDCVPNSSPEQIKERTAYLVEQIRKLHPTAPIIVMQSVIREHGYFDNKVGERVKQQNIQIKKEFEALQKKGVKYLYFIPAENFLGKDHEGSTDGIHPNDIGFYRMVQVIQPVIVDVLKKHGIITGNALSKGL
jgi:hypothetical protein